MFSEHTAPIGTYDIPIDSDFYADGCMKPKNGPQALTGCSLGLGLHSIFYKHSLYKKSASKFQKN